MFAFNFFFFFFFPFALHVEPDRSLCISQVQGCKADRPPGNLVCGQLFMICAIVSDGAP